MVTAAKGFNGEDQMILGSMLTSFFVDLDGGEVALETNDLTDQLGVAYAHQLIHSRTGHLLGSDD